MMAMAKKADTGLMRNSTAKTSAIRMRMLGMLIISKPHCQYNPYTCRARALSVQSSGTNQEACQMQGWYWRCIALRYIYRRPWDIAMDFVPTVSAGKEARLPAGPAQ